MQITHFLCFISLLGKLQSLLQSCNVHSLSQVHRRILLFLSVSTISRYFRVRIDLNFSLFEARTSCTVRAWCALINASIFCSVSCIKIAIRETEKIIDSSTEYASNFKENQMQITTAIDPDEVFRSVSDNFFDCVFKTDCVLLTSFIFAHLFNNSMTTGLVSTKRYLPANSENLLFLGCGNYRISTPFSSVFLRNLLNRFQILDRFLRMSSFSTVLETYMLFDLKESYCFTFCTKCRASIQKDPRGYCWTWIWHDPDRNE